MVLATGDLIDDHTGSLGGIASSSAIEREYSEIFKGSGAPSYGEFLSDRSGHFKITVIKKQSEKETPSHVARIQDEILDTFGISMQDLAEACQVSRKTPYNWRTTERTVDRHKKGMDRLFQLSQAARDWKNSGYTKPGSSLRAPLVKGQSLYDLLLATKIDNDAIQFLGTRMTMAQLGDNDINNPFA